MSIDTDVPPPEYNPLYVTAPERRWGREWNELMRRHQQLPFTTLVAGRDPFFFHYCDNLEDWSHVAAFSSGVLVFSEEITEEDRKKILQYDVSFVLHRQHAWPEHWCLGTSALEVFVGWEAAQQRYRVHCL
jgi:hypothetical protein